MSYDSIGEISSVVDVPAMGDFQRGSIRINVAEERRRAVVLYGTRQFDCTLIDESAGGYMVRFHEQIHLPLGTNLKLRTETTWTLVTVARCRMLNDGLEVGLQRQEDLPDQKELNSLLPKWSSYLTSWRGKYDGIMSAVGVVVLGFGVWMWMAYYFTGQPVPPAVSHAFAGTIGRLLPSSGPVPATREAQAARTFVSVKLGEVLRQLQDTMPEAGRDPKQVRDDCARYARQRILTLPEVVPALGLSKTQARKIRETVLAAEERILEKLRDQKKDKSAADTARQWLIEVEAEVLGMLSPQQRTAWQEMVTPADNDAPVTVTAAGL